MVDSETAYRSASSSTPTGRERRIERISARRSRGLTSTYATARRSAGVLGRREVGGLSQRLDHAGLLGLARARDVEGGPVVDAGADDRQADGDVDAGLDAEDLDGPVPLVVVHRHDQVEVPAAGPEEDGVRRERSLGIDAARPGGRDAGRD